MVLPDFTTKNIVKIAMQGRHFRIFISEHVLKQGDLPQAIWSTNAIHDLKVWMRTKTMMHLTRWRVLNSPIILSPYTYFRVHIWSGNESKYSVSDFLKLKRMELGLKRISKIDSLGCCHNSRRVLESIIPFRNFEFWS